MGVSKPLQIVRLVLTEEEREILEREAADRHLSLSAILRESLAETLDEFRAVTYERTGNGGRRRVRAS